MYRAQTNWSLCAAGVNRVNKRPIATLSVGSLSKSARRDRSRWIGSRHCCFSCPLQYTQKCVQIRNCAWPRRRLFEVFIIVWNSSTGCTDRVAWRWKYSTGLRHSNAHPLRDYHHSGGLGDDMEKEDEVAVYSSFRNRSLLLPEQWVSLCISPGFFNHNLIYD